MIKKIPAYAKFLKDLCAAKRELNIEKNAFLTHQVSAITEKINKHKDLGGPTISVTIRDTHIEKALLDLGASVNILPYSVFQQFDLRELKPTNITLSLVDRLIKKPRGIVEDIIVQVDTFYYPLDFVALDIEQSTKGNNIPIILGRPFLATSNALINCRNGLKQLTFGDMTREINIFNILKKSEPIENDPMDVFAIDSVLEEHVDDLIGCLDPYYECLDEADTIFEPP